MKQRHAGIVFTIIGLVASIFILIANSRGILIDSVATDMGVNAWEIAFGTYMLFLTGGVVLSMLSSYKRRDTRSRAEDIVLTIMTFIFSMFFLQVSAVGILQTDVNSMLTEFYSWYYYYAFLLSVYIIAVFMG